MNGPDFFYFVTIVTILFCLIDDSPYMRRIFVERIMVSRQILRLALCCALYIFCGCMQAMATDVSLAWDASASADVTGYKIYVGTASGTYDAPTTIGNLTSYTVTGLSSGTYYFSVTAYDASGNESGFSNEVSKTIAAAHTCDVNGDSTVNAIDLQKLANIILGLVQSSSSYDLNGDGSVDALDLQILNNVVLGIRSCP
jgi:hypothetical protein